MTNPLRPASQLDKRHKVTIDSIDLTRLTCHRGSVIRVRPQRRMKLLRVELEIQNLLGKKFEGGPATWDPATGDWCYVTCSDLPREIRRIQVTGIGPHHICSVLATQMPV